MEAGRRGVDAVPTLLKKMFSRVLWLAAVVPINLTAVVIYGGTKLSGS